MPQIRLIEIPLEAGTYELPEGWNAVAHERKGDSLIVVCDPVVEKPDHTAQLVEMAKLICLSLLANTPGIEIMSTGSSTNDDDLPEA